MPSPFHLSLHAKCAKTMNENMTSKEVFTVYVTQFTVKEDQNSSHPRLVIAGILEVYTATHTHTHTSHTSFLSAVWSTLIVYSLEVRANHILNIRACQMLLHA
ncbi:hypothetical protein XENORESO_016586 [Xenotaenia resolanae]|uniref:Uncharacterized protein n=1 Tax=Xenotaenia resolanae TaxID=208358 RepID=A0ABV0WX61_9TELE